MITLRIANTFISLSKDQGVPLTYLELQCLIHNVAIRGQKITGKPIFEEKPICYKSQMIPIYKSIHDAFNENSHLPVTKLAFHKTKGIRTLNLESDDLGVIVCKSVWFDFLKERLNRTYYTYDEIFG